MKYIDITGQRFGHLQVLERAENNPGGAVRFLCQCDCGKRKIIMAKHLKSGAIDNCGCLRVDRMVESRLQNGTMHSGSATRLYRIWSGMKSRCYNPHRERYPDYGGRGITVCEEWRQDFSAFQEWAFANGYADDLSIDRIDDDKGYSPDNCRWATIKQQNNNRRKRRWRKRPERVQS